MSNRTVRYWTDVLQQLSSLLSIDPAAGDARVAALSALETSLQEASHMADPSRAACKKLIRDSQVRVDCKKTNIQLHRNHGCQCCGCGTASASVRCTGGLSLHPVRHAALTVC